MNVSAALLAGLIGALSAAAYFRLLWFGAKTTITDASVHFKVIAFGILRLVVVGATLFGLLMLVPRVEAGLAWLVGFWVVRMVAVRIVRHRVKPSTGDPS